MVPHAHRESHLIFHLDGPDAEVVVDGTPVRLSPRQGVAVNPWRPHFCRTFPGAKHALMLVLYIRQPWFAGVRGRPGPELCFGRAHLTITSALNRMVRRLHFLLAENGEADPAFEACLADLAAAAHQQTWQDWPPGERSVWLGGRVFDYRIRRALRLMDSTLGESIDLAAVSREAGLSRPHFFKLFREQVGLPPTIYRNALRLERAIDRLARGEENVAEIGLDLGFATPASFSRFFAANSVVPPSAYRRSVHARYLQ